jgi:phosphatidylglycerophosphate synthase
MMSAAWRHAPILLTALRAGLAPVLVVLAHGPPARGAFAICLTAGFLSDVFDGILARRLGVATSALRRLDSIADTIFYVGALYALWRISPGAILARAPALAVLVVLEAIRYGFDWLKFRREASYHMWSSKAWGIALFGAFLSLLGLGRDGVIVDVAIYVGIAADLEGLAISWILPRWRSDVPTFVHALRARGAGAW